MCFSKKIGTKKLSVQIILTYYHTASTYSRHRGGAHLTPKFFYDYFLFLWLSFSYAGLCIQNNLEPDKKPAISTIATDKLWKIQAPSC